MEFGRLALHIGRHGFQPGGFAIEFGGARIERGFLPLNVVLVLSTQRFEFVALLPKFGDCLIGASLLLAAQLFDRAAQLADLMLLRIALGFELLRNSPSLVFCLLAANFELLGFTGKPFFKLLAPATAAGQLFGLALQVGLRLDERLPDIGGFDPGRFDILALARQVVLLPAEFGNQGFVFAEAVGERLIATGEIVLQGLGVGRQTIGRGSQERVDLRRQIRFDIFQPRGLGGEKQLRARTRLRGAEAGCAPAERGVSLKFMLFHVRPWTGSSGCNNGGNLRPTKNRTPAGRTALGAVSQAYRTP
jgi:hypothetical protein